MEPEGSLPYSQASATCPYPGPTQSSPHTHIPKAPTLNKLIRGGLKAPTNYLKFISMEELCKKQKIRMKVRKESCLNFHELMAHSKV